MHIIYIYICIRLENKIHYDNNIPYLQMFDDKLAFAFLNSVNLKNMLQIRNKKYLF